MKRDFKCKLTLQNRLVRYNFQKIKNKEIKSQLKIIIKELYISTQKCFFQEN